MEWATYVGAGGESNAIAVDQLGRVYIVGDVYVDDFPLLNPWSSVNYGDGDEDGFISIFDPDGQLIYSTYISGPNRDQLYDITVDDHGHIYVAGMTSSPKFPVHNAVQSVYGGGWEDCLVFKLDPWNNELHFATFLGGSDREACLGIDIDQERNIYVTGYTSSPNFPTINAHQANKKAVNASATDAFVACLSPSGTMLHYTTYLGGSDVDRGWDIVTDHRGYSYIVGHTDSLDFPTRNALQSSHGGGVRDGFVAIFNPNGVLQYASYLGGAGFEILRGIALDGNWIAHIAGETNSEHLATAGAFQTQYAGTGEVDTLLARFAFIPTPTPTPTPIPFAAADIGPEGGAVWLSYPQHLTLLQVPAGALSETTAFELVYDSHPNAQSDRQGLNHFFTLSITPAQNVNYPLPLILGYNETLGVIRDTIRLYRLEGSTWVTNGITASEQSTILLGQLRVQVKAPGIYGLLGETRRLYMPLILKH